MTTFFDLPLPIRGLIYSELLNSYFSPPKSLKQFLANDPYQRIYRHGSSLAEANIEGKIRYPSRIHLPFAGLLRVNRQLRREMKHAIEEHTSRKVDCKLDLVVECENRVYPTWLMCPSRSPVVRRLEVDVRLLGCAGVVEMESCDHLRGRFRCRSLAFAIVAVFARFVERGAKFEHARGEIAVHTLVLNFETRIGGQKFLQLTPVVSGDGEDWETDTLVEDGSELGDDGEDNGYAAAIDGPELLSMVDLVLRPLCREEQDMLPRRQRHFSAAHLALIRRNVRRIFLHLDGRLEKRVQCKGAKSMD